MGYTFAYFFPRSLVTVGAFAIYYVAVFYVIELVFPPLEKYLSRFVTWLFTFK
jgi:hypothetical protein